MGWIGKGIPRGIKDRSIPERESHAQKSASTYLVLEASSLSPSRSSGNSVENPIALERDVDNVVALQNNALLLLLLLGQESGTCGVFKNLTDAFVGLR